MDENEDVPLTITEGHILLIAEILRIERGLDKMPMSGVPEILAQAIKNLT